MESWKKLWTAFHKLQEEDRQDGVWEVVKQLVGQSLEEKNRYNAISKLQITMVYILGEMYRLQI